MGNTHKRGWQGTFTSLLPFLLLAVSSAFTTTFDGPAPANVSIASQTSSSVSFTWDGVDNPDGFKIWYYRSENNFTSQPAFTEEEAISFSDLTAGTYDFFFVAIHGETYSECAVTSDIIME
ncbi:MAG: hypothetical protein HUU01_01995 [Saprospiraceae bacterium]|nr:hypothetical protein [Saprospiraceae bacterium]